MSAEGHDEALDEHLRRIEGYMRGCTLLRFPRARSALRDELARVLDETMPDVVAGWVAPDRSGIRHLGGPVAGRSRDDIEIALRALGRVTSPTRRTATPTSYLRSHARRGFISKFPASRFLSGQIKVFQLMENAIRRRYADDQPRRDGAAGAARPGVRGAHPPHHRLLRRGARGGAARAGGDLPPLDRQRAGGDLQDRLGDRRRAGGELRRRAEPRVRVRGAARHDELGPASARRARRRRSRSGRRRAPRATPTATICTTARAAAR